MTQDIREQVKKVYGQAAVAATTKGQKAGCCGSGPATGAKDPITRDLYTEAEASGVPADALLASFGCGNPTALADLREGEAVLDLGSGGGIDVLLSARRVGPTGKAYGLDMTPEMLALARKNQAAAGATNVEFLEGTLEAIPLPDASVDVIISNCVINLSGDKPRVLAEAFRVLKPGGRFAVSDVVLRRPLPPLIKSSIEAWAGCVAGALLEGEYIDLLTQAGFIGVSVEPTRIYTRADAKELLEAAVGGCCGSALPPGLLSEVDGAAMSAFVRAVKPR